MNLNDLFIVKEINEDDLPQGPQIVVSESGWAYYGEITMYEHRGVMRPCVFPVGSGGTICVPVIDYLAPVTLAELKLMKEEGG